MVASAASFAVMAAAAKMLPHIPALEKVLFRSLLSVLLTYWALRKAKDSIRPNKPVLLLARSFLGFAGLWCYFEAIQRIPLGTAVTIYNTTPLFAAAVGVFFFRERFSKLQTASLFIGVGGIALIKGLSPDLAWTGVLFGFGTALFSACAYSLVRLLTRTEHPMVIVLAFPLISIPLSLLLGWNSFLMPQKMDWFWLILLGLGTQGGQVCLTHGLKHHSASRATQIGFVGVIFAMLLGIPMGDGFPTLPQLAGATLVFASLTLGRAKNPRPIQQS
jgi:drug/metabolite transporter (DMT)-like permease